VTLKQGAIVVSRIEGKMLERVNGKPGEKMIPFSKGEVGRVLGVRREQKAGVPKVYLIKFIRGVVELIASHLASVSSDETKLIPAAATIADPNLKIEKAPIENEPDY
jgi:hypothetical protein